MSTELKQAAQQALEALETCRIRSVSEWSVEDVTPKNITAAIAALRTAIQQAEAKTDEPVQADSSGPLRVIASLGAALRRLSFTAQTTGGTAGPDAELQSAIGQAEQALSLGGIGQAMFATTEPVGAREALERIASWSEHPAMLGVDYGSNGVRDYYRKIARDALTNPAPGVPDDVVRDADAGA